MRSSSRMRRSSSVSMMARGDHRYCKRKRSNPESFRRGVLDCFIASAPRNDEPSFSIQHFKQLRGCDSAFPRRDFARVLHQPCPSREEGAGNTGCFSLTHGLVCKRKHTSSSPQVQPLHRRSLRDGVNAYIRALPGVRDLIVTVACRSRRAGPEGPTSPISKLSASPGAPGPHDFAVRNSRARRTRSCVHRIPRPTLVTIAKRPLCPESLAGCANGRLQPNRPSLELSP
jgi:hypothetical protein